MTPSRVSPRTVRSPRRTAATPPLCIALLAWLVAGCHHPRAQIVLLVRTDMSQGPGQTLTAVRVVVRSQDDDPAGPPRFDQVQPLGTGDNPVELPATLLGISARDNDASRTVSVEVSALHDGVAMFTTYAVAQFGASGASLLEVGLWERCQLPEARVCPPGFTCGRVDCEPIRRPTLPPFDGGLATRPPSDGGPCPPPDGAPLEDPDNAASTASCAPPPASPPPAIALLDFEGPILPVSRGGAFGMRESDAARGAFVRPGAGGSAAGAEFTVTADPSLFFQFACRRRYAYGLSTYEPRRANALELWLRVPAGSPLIAPSGSGATFEVRTYHWRPYDPWVGPNAGNNLTDSYMSGNAGLRVAPGGADRWLRAVLTPSAFKNLRDTLDYYPARATVGALGFVGSLRQFAVSYVVPRAAPTALGLDEVRLVTQPETAQVCPSYATREVARAAAGPVAIAFELRNPTSRARTYRAFASSLLGLDIATMEALYHAADTFAAATSAERMAGGGGGIGAVELYADAGGGVPTGPDLLAAGGAGIAVAAGGTWRGVLVHRLDAAMLGDPVGVTAGTASFSVRRDTLTTSVVVWDPLEPPVSDPDVVSPGSDADQPHAQPPGFPAFRAPPAGWGSADVPIDQMGGYFVSVIRLRP